MKVLPLHPELKAYLKTRQLEKKFEKQLSLFKENPFHPSLRTELLEPRRMKIWSFRIDKKYRTLFIFIEKDTVEIIDVNDHYQ
jgi:Txe/YoeB family toxin of Txe-Axe toxin-antitoxin module